MAATGSDRTPQDGNAPVADEAENPRGRVNTERDAQSGDVVQFKHPEWRPLTALLGERLAERFMWMHEIRLADGTTVHAYKHVRTRRYLNLALDGRAFAYLGDAYFRIETSLAVMRVVPQRERPARSTSSAPC